MSDDQTTIRYLAEIGRRPVAEPEMQLAWARAIDAAQQTFNEALLACSAARAGFLALLGDAADARWLARRVGGDQEAHPAFSPDPQWTPEQTQQAFRGFMASLRLSRECMAELRARVQAGPQDDATRAFLAVAGRAQREIDAATDRLVHANQRLVVNLARQYRYAPLAFMDLVQEGNLGLLRAIERFDPEHGARVSTYALWWVRRAMVYAIARQGHAVRPPVQQYWAARQVQRALNRLEATAGCGKLRAAARELGVSVAAIQEMAAVLIPAAALHTTADGEAGPYIDRLAAADIADPEGSAMERDLRRAVAALLEHLPERQAKILRMRFGIDVFEGCTLEQIAQQQGVTRERIRQIEAQALDALRVLDLTWRLRACLT